MDRRQRGETETQAITCFTWVIVLVVHVIITIVVGGLFRTDVTFPHTAKLTGKAVPFEENLTARHWIGGLAKGKQPDLNTALSKYMRAGEEVSELTVTTRHTIVDNILAVVTLGIYTPVTVTVKGTLVSPEKKSAADIGGASEALPRPDVD